MKNGDLINRGPEEFALSINPGCKLVDCLQPLPKKLEQVTKVKFRQNPDALESLKKLKTEERIEKIILEVWSFRMNKEKKTRHYIE